MQLESTSMATVADIPGISRAELQSRLNNPSLTILDVLPAEAYAAQHIPGALNLPIDNIQARVSEILPDKNAEIAVYCAKFT